MSPVTLLPSIPPPPIHPSFCQLAEDESCLSLQGYNSLPSSHSLNISPPHTSPPRSFRLVSLSLSRTSLASPSVSLHRLCFVLRLSEGARLSHPPSPSTFSLSLRESQTHPPFMFSSSSPAPPHLHFPLVHPAVPKLPCLLTVTVRTYTIASLDFPL